MTYLQRFVSLSYMKRVERGRVRMSGQEVLLSSRVELLSDRQSAMWGVRLLQIVGELALVGDDGQLFVVFVEDGDRDTWAFPLSDVACLGDAPPFFGSHSLAALALRVDFAGKRRIVVFQGDRGEGQAALNDLNMDRVMGDLDPVSIVKGVRSLLDMPGTMRRAKEAREVWRSVLESGGSALELASSTPPGARRSAGSALAAMPIGPRARFCFEDVAGWATAVAFSPDGHFLAGAHSGGVVKLWLCGTGQEVFQLAYPREEGAADHDPIVNAIAFSPDGQFLATGADDATARLWRVRDGSEARCWVHPDTVEHVEFGPDGANLLTVSDCLPRLWAVEGEGALVWEPSEDEIPLCTYATFAGGGRRLLITSQYRVILCDWVSSTVDDYDDVLGDLMTDKAMFTPSDTILVPLDSGGFLTVDPESRTAAAEEKYGHAGPIVAFSADPPLVATGGEEKVTVWDATTGASLFVLPHDDEVDYVCFSPDGTLLATASVSGVRVWTLDSVE
ncbi:MAG TPA: hypothetical protein VIP82_02910 [Microbacterium sp.]|uniref:WD40 repeat domain-containing protein n=1 Tax=Microbacterium sp. TaxID=51671 RepID=UPI002F953869